MAEHVTNSQDRSTTATAEAAHPKSYLTKDEARQLDECEEVIKRGLQTFVEVGEALRTIRDERLYRDEYDDFETYLREKWSLSKPYASQLIVGADVVAIATADGLPAPANEAVARELGAMRDDPYELRDTWDDAAVDAFPKAPTAAQTREHVQRARPPKGKDNASDHRRFPITVAEKLARNEAPKAVLGSGATMTYLTAAGSALEKAAEVAARDRDGWTDEERADLESRADQLKVELYRTHRAIKGLDNERKNR